MFIDPKGLHYVAKDDPKIEFYKTIKDIEARLGDPDVALHAFILSETPSHLLSKHWGQSRSEMEQRNVLFPREDRDQYVERLIGDVCPSRI